MQLLNIITIIAKGNPVVIIKTKLNICTEGCKSKWQVAVSWLVYFKILSLESAVQYFCIFVFAWHS